MKNKQNKLLRYPLAGLFLLAGMATAAAEVPGDMVFEREDQSEVASFPPSIFQHWKHRVNYRCDACHDSLFEMKIGATTVTMEMINAGQACGACHNGEIAFGGDYVNCDRCHKSPTE